MSITLNWQVDLEVLDTLSPKEFEKATFVKTGNGSPTSKGLICHGFITDVTKTKLPALQKPWRDSRQRCAASASGNPVRSTLARSNLGAWARQWAAQMVNKSGRLMSGDCNMRDSAEWAPGRPLHNNTDKPTPIPTPADRLTFSPGLKHPQNLDLWQHVRAHCRLRTDVLAESTARVKARDDCKIAVRRNTCSISSGTRFKYHSWSPNVDKRVNIVGLGPKWWSCIALWHEFNVTVLGPVVAH